jgi:hypothetical protein
MKDYKYWKWKDYRINEKTFLLIIDDIYLRGTFFKNRTKSKIEKKKFSIFIFLILFSDSLYLN